MPLPTVTHASFNLVAIGKGRPVVQPVIDKPRLLVMASGTLANDDGQYVAEVGRRLIGRLGRCGGALRQSPGARDAPENGQQRPSNQTRPLSIMGYEFVHGYVGDNQLRCSTRRLQNPYESWKSNWLFRVGSLLWRNS